MNARKSETISTILSTVNLKHLIFSITRVSRELFIFNKSQISNLRNKWKHGLLFIMENKSITCGVLFSPVIQGSQDYERRVTSMLEKRITQCSGVQDAQASASGHVSQPAEPNPLMVEITWEM